MSSTLLARLHRNERDAQRDAAGLFFYYRREMRWGATRALYYSRRRAIFHDALTLARMGY